ncbi:hypothetical protein JXD20_02140 [Candidatus Peregrinibacteria bacterium]|nr:hypothetical protein [Candidatus Peregrinibacteria bacterium]
MELLIVVFIILLVLSIGGNTYRNQRKHVIYNDSVAHVSDLIKTARNYALTSRSVYDTCQPEGQEVYVPAEGYGVYFIQVDSSGLSRAVLFANTKTSPGSAINQYDETGDSCASDIIEEDYYLPDETRFTGLSIDRAQPHTKIGGALAAQNQVVIIFRPPLADPVIVVNDHASLNSLTYLNDLYLQFLRPGSSTYHYIHFNRIAGFPEIQKR